MTGVGRYIALHNVNELLILTTANRTSIVKQQLLLNI